MQINWCGLTFHGDAGDATYSIEPDGLTGILDGVSVRDDHTPRPTADGTFDSPAYLGGRAGSITGLVETWSDGEYVHAIQRLTSIPALALSRLTALGAGRAMWTDARRVGEVSVKHLVYGRVARYMVQWFAPDPRMYGDLNTFGPGSSLSVFHRGNTAAVPVVEIVGAVTAPYTVASQGHSFTVTQSLTDGQTHRIDMSTGWVYRDGVLQAGVVSSADVFTIPPGSAVTVTGPASMKILVTETFA